MVRRLASGGGVSEKTRYSMEGLVLGNARLAIFLAARRLKDFVGSSRAGRAGGPGPPSGNGGEVGTRLSSRGRALWYLSVIPPLAWRVLSGLSDCRGIHERLRGLPLHHLKNGYEIRIYVYSTRLSC